LKGAILLIEAGKTGPGAMDSQLTMLRKAGHLTGLAGIAVGQFNDCFHPVNGFTVVDLLRDHLRHFKIPILGGLPVGHGHEPQTTLVGAIASLDAAAGTSSTVSGLFRRPGAAGDHAIVYRLYRKNRLSSDP
jgi:muramoyltetrapeptide carboxypeptidase